MKNNMTVAVYKCNESLKTKTSLCRQAALEADKQPAPEAFIFHFSIGFDH